MAIPMKKLMVEGSHFALVNGKMLSDKNVVQIWPEMVYMNKSTGYAVFLCEVVDEKESEDK